MNIISIKKLCFHYEAGIEENALRNVSLDIHRGECLVLTGESGCGKTTLTRCLNGLIPGFFEGRLTGDIYYEGRLFSEMEQYEISNHIGTVFQDPRSQFFTVNSTDEAAFGCENLGFSTEKINQNVTAAFECLQIDELKDRSLFKLSSGEKQKLAVASVYAMEPDVIILDEPTANLDRETIKTLQEMLIALKNQGKTLIISEHRLSWLNGLADRYVYMTDGKIGQIWNAKAARSLSPEALQRYGLRCIQDPSPRKYQQMKKYSNAKNEIEGVGLSVSFKTHTVIKDLNFHFTWGSDGKVIGIVGENGSGKTTFSKILCGLLKPVSGEILLNGKLCNQNERIKKTYFVMQDADYQLFTESVAHEIELASHKNVSTKEKLSTVEMNRILQKFYLTNFSDCHPLSLSGGQKQRVTIASAIAAMPDILVMDEPTSGLDGKNMLRLKNTISDLKQQGKLVFIITHDEEFLDGLADEIMPFSPAGENQDAAGRKGVPSSQGKEKKMNHKVKRESPIKGILRFASQRKGELRFAVILSVLSSAFGIVPYAIVGVLLGNALDGSLTVNLVIILTLAALLGYFLKFYLYAKSTMCSHKAAYEIIRNIRCAIMRKMSRMSMGAIQEKSSGEFKQLIMDDTERLEGQIAHAIPEMTASILIPVFVFIFLMLVDWHMALASLISAILGNIIYYGMMIGRGDMMKTYMSANADMNGTIVEYVGGMEVIRVFNQTASSMGRFQSAVLRVRDITTTWYRHCYPFMSIGQAIMPSTIVFVLPIGVKLLSGGNVTLNEVILCILLSMSLVGSLQAMIEFWQDLAAIYEIQPRIQSILDAPELSEPNEPKYCKGADVELKDVHFSYKDREVIHGISFAAKAGTVTALVGPSGSGKSTLAKLIARFWDVDSGSVIVGGADVRQLSLTDLSEQISYVSQDNFLFHMSLRENILIGRPDASNEDVERAAAQAGCNEFIARFPQGYDTNAGDSGARLSGGERQRIAIARAILKNAPIVILDEATAFADPENEDKLQRSIDRLTKGKTLIVIAHRLSTIMYADQILVLEDGAITAGGTHEQLLSSSQTYLDMWSAHISAMDWSIKQEVNTSC